MIVRTHTAELDDVMGIEVTVEYWVEQDEYGPPYPLIENIWIGDQLVGDEICTQAFLDEVERKLMRPEG